MTDFAARRRAMVDCQVRPSDVTKFPIIDAMLSVPREQYLPASARDIAYIGDHVALEPGRVALDPRVLAKMLDALDIKGDDMVLDIGPGYGYSTAVIAQIAEAVIAVEEDVMASEAEANLNARGVDNAFVISGDLVAGAAKHGPYDAVIFEGGIETVSPEIIAQVKIGGRVAAIKMDGPLGQVMIGINRGNHLDWRFAFNATAPVLPGFEEKRAFAL
jgi:protein-L-isoaspartate(D-aspartate) O-methyltransferase